MQDPIDLATSNSVTEEEMSEILFIDDPKNRKSVFLTENTQEENTTTGKTYM